MKKLTVIFCLLFSLLLCSCGSTAPVADKAPATTTAAPHTETTAPLVATANVPKAAADLMGQDFSDVMYLFRGAGFTDVQTEAVDDLSGTTAKLNNQVFSVSIGNAQTFTPGEEFPANTPIVIRYHHLKMIELPLSPTEAKGKDYLSVVKLLAEAGFTNITTDEIYTDNALGTTILVSGYEQYIKTQPIPFDTPIVVTEALPQRKYEVSITIDFDGNWILDRHDITVAVNGESAGNLEHGKDGVFQYQLPAGEHQITVTSLENSASTATLVLTVDSDTQVTYHVKTHSKTIDFSEKQITRAMQKDQLRLTKSSNYYLGKNYIECITVLQEEGFTNISLRSSWEELWGPTTTGAVVSITIDGKDGFAHGDIISKNAPVKITYYAPPTDLNPG